MEITNIQMDRRLFRHILIGTIFVFQYWSYALAVPCSSKCTTCEVDSGGHVVKVVCTDINIPLIPDSVQEMYLSDGSVSKPGIFKDYVFIGKTDLRVIQLKKYNIKMVWESPFINLTNLIEVDLSFNDIPDFDKSNLAGPVALQILNLNRNKIHQINDDAFVNQTSLKELFMSFNQVTRIPANAFRGLQSLEHLDLSYNLLTTIDSQAFQDCPSLRILSLRGNRLDIVAPHLFHSLSHLQSVDLQRNRLFAIGQDAFIGTNITFLDMSRNRLHDVRSTMAVLKILSGEDVLVSLKANHLNISYAPGVLSGVTLKRLDLDYNGITIFPQDTFANTHIRNLSLAHNNLKFLPSSMEAYLTGVKPTITLDNNNWQCDCRLLWFSKYLHKLSPPDLGTRLQNTLQCSSPGSLQNKLIQDVATDIESGCKTTSVKTLVSTVTNPIVTRPTTTVSMAMTPSVTRPTTGISVPVQTLPGVGLGPNGLPSIQVTGTTGKMVTSSGGGDSQSVPVSGGMNPTGLPQAPGGMNHMGLPQGGITTTGSTLVHNVTMTTGLTPGSTSPVSLNSGQSKSQTGTESSNSSFPIGAVVGPLAALCLIGGAIGWFLYRKKSKGTNGTVNGNQPHEPEETDYLWDKHQPVTRSLGPSKTYFNSNTLKNFHSYQA